MATEQQTPEAAASADGAAGTDSLSVTDNRTGKTYELPISDGTVRGMDLRQIKVHEDDFGLMSFDPAFTNTAVLPLRRSPTSTAPPASSNTAATRSRPCARTRPTSRSPTC